MQNPFRYFNSSPEVIRLAVIMYIRYPLMKRYGQPWTIVTDRLRCYGAAMKVIGNLERQKCGVGSPTKLRLFDKIP